MAEPSYQEKKYGSRHCWLKDKNEWDEAGVFVCLSRAPLTFGHSQLTVDVKGDPPDEEMFNKAVPLIRATIRTFQDMLPMLLREDKDSTWADLARWTKTRGPYIKTLILRTSASEKPEEAEEAEGPQMRFIFKVHLVPYFKSHEDACYDMFQDKHNVSPHKRGGLLGWLGVREDEADELEVDWPCDTDKDKCAKEFFKLDKLAEKLRPIAKEHYDAVNQTEDKDQDQG